MGFRAGPSRPLHPSSGFQDPLQSPAHRFPPSKAASLHPSPAFATGLGLIQPRLAQPNPRQWPTPGPGLGSGPDQPFFPVCPSSLLTCKAKDQNSPALTRPKYI